MTNTQSPAPGVVANQTAFRAMCHAHSFCPTDLPHFDRMRWMAKHMESALQASAAGGKSVGYIGFSVVNGNTVAEPRMTNHDLPIGTELYTAPPLPAQVQAAEVTTDELHRLAWELMPTIDDYASDYRNYGQQSPRRQKVQDELKHALRDASRTPAPGMAGGVGAEPQEETLCDCGQPWGTPHHCAYQNGHDIYANPPVTAPHPSPAPQAAGAAFDDGWRLCAKWAHRDDLLPDMDSKPYLEAKAICLAVITASGRDAS